GERGSLDRRGASGVVPGPSVVVGAVSEPPSGAEPVSPLLGLLGFGFLRLLGLRLGLWSGLRGGREGPLGELLEGRLDLVEITGQGIDPAFELGSPLLVALLPGLGDLLLGICKIFLDLRSICHCTCLGLFCTCLLFTHTCS